MKNKKEGAEWEWGGGATRGSGGVSQLYALGGSGGGIAVLCYRGVWGGGGIAALSGPARYRAL